MLFILGVFLSLYQILCSCVDSGVNNVFILGLDSFILCFLVVARTSCLLQQQSRLQSSTAETRREYTILTLRETVNIRLLFTSSENGGCPTEICLNLNKTPLVLLCPGHESYMTPKS